MLNATAYNVLADSVSLNNDYFLSINRLVSLVVDNEILVFPEPRFNVNII